MRDLYSMNQKKKKKNPLRFVHFNIGKRNGLTDEMCFTHSIIHRHRAGLRSEVVPPRVETKCGIISELRLNNILNQKTLLNTRGNRYEKYMHFFFSCDKDSKKRRKRKKYIVQ